MRATPANLPLPAPEALARQAQRLAAVRAQTLALAAPLGEADCQVQSMPDASPVKWHLAHTTWFFETFVLAPHARGHRPCDPAWLTLFNSYYQAVGPQHPRPQRGLLTRPGLAEVLAWRQRVDEALAGLLARPLAPEVAALVELGLQHEQQHQELIQTDLLHLLGGNPLAPVYLPPGPEAPAAADDGGPAWAGVDGGLVALGHGGTGFAFDNEGPRHQAWLAPYALARRPVSQADFAAFVADGGYQTLRWWMSAGWDWRQREGITAPLHWRAVGDARAGLAAWRQFTLRGLLPLQAEAPVVHVSWFEADAYARWHAAQHPQQPPSRLPTEAEWEHAAAAQLAARPATRSAGNWLESGALRPLPASPGQQGLPLQQLLGDVWEWTVSPYTAYPGYRPWQGAVGEYNGKFMVDQWVLRGGSCASPIDHLRCSYRNFFPATARWQFSGLRLARDAG